MTQKEMKKLSRRRMLEMLAEQTGRTNRLQRENERLKERIAEREQHLAQLGELAKTVLNSDSSPDGELTKADESAAKAFSGSPDRGSLTEPNAVVAENVEIAAVTQAASGNDADWKPDGSIKTTVSNVIEVIKNSRKSAVPPTGDGSVTGDHPVRSGTIVKDLEEKVAAVKKNGAEAAPNASIGSNILSTASSLAMLGTAAVLLITRKNGKDS